MFERQGDIKAPPPDRAGVREVCSPSNIFIMKASHRALSVSITGPRTPEAGQSYLRRLSSDGGGGAAGALERTRRH